MHGPAQNQNSRSQHMDNTPIAGTSYQNIRADEIIKKYHHSNTDV